MRKFIPFVLVFSFFVVGNAYAQDMSKPVPAMAMEAAMTAPMEASKVPVMASVKVASMEVSKVPVMAPVKAEFVKEKAVEVKKVESNKDAWWKVLLDGLIQVVLLFALSILVMLGKFGVSWVGKKLKIADKEDIEKLNSLYDTAIAYGVNYASQKAHKMSNDPDSKGQRIKWASDKVEEWIKEWKLPEKSAEWIKNRIEAKIGEKERK